MRIRQRLRFIWVFLIGIGFAFQCSQAQYASDYQTNIISGVTSNWTGDYQVGNTNSADALLIENGGGLTGSGYSFLGYDVSSSNNSALVTDPGSVWSNNNNLYVGYEGSGNSLVISNAAQVISGVFGLVGTESSSASNQVVVTGPGSVWSYSYGLFIGSYGSSDNTLVIANGAQVFGSEGYIAFSGGNGNHVLVTGSGSVWSNSYLTVGGDGAGDNSLVISNGGHVVSSTRTTVGTSGNGNSVLVAGTGSIWENDGTLYIGASGVGNQLIITNGGMIYSGTTFVGSAGTSNTILVTGLGSVWSNSSLLYLGGAGGGDQLVISKGGTVYGGSARVGANTEGNGSSYNKVLVGDPGSAWINSGSLSVGYAGIGNQLIITNGGTVYSGTGYVGYFDTALSSTVLVTGPGSVWSNSSSLYVGYQGSQSQLMITKGGTVYTGSGYLGGNNFNSRSSNNKVLVSDIGSVWNNAGALSVGNDISQGNSLIISNSGMVSASMVVVWPNNSIVLNNGNLIAANGLTICSNAMLNGIGTVVGATTINSSGILSPGDGPGTITFSNNLTLADGSTFAMALNGTGAGQGDQIVIFGTVSVSNSVLSLSLGYTPAVGDSFTIVSNQGPSGMFGVFLDPQGDVLTNNAIFLADGIAFEIDYNGNPDGQDVTLTAVVPEPATWLLVGLGTFTILFGCHRIR